MTTQQHPFLTTLQEWEQINELSMEASDTEIQTDKTAQVLLRVAKKPRGKAQQLPSAVLQPV